jgi:hypothetical protein
MNMEEIEELAQMFDTIIMSQNKAVQESFRSLVVLAKLTEQQESVLGRKSSAGPFHDLTVKLRWLEEQFQYVKRDVQILQNNSRSGYDLGATGSSSSYAWDPVSAQNMASVLSMNPSIGALTTAQVAMLQSPINISLTDPDLFTNIGTNGTT